MAARIIAALARLAPAWRREEWKQEWLGEIEHYRERHQRFGRWTLPARVRLVARSCGASAHVLDLWRHEWSLDMFWTDISFALRLLAKRPAVALSAVLTVAVTVSLVTAVFTAVNGVLLKPLPYPRSERLVLVWPRLTVSPAEMQQLLPRLREHLASVAGFSRWGFAVAAGGGPEKLAGARVTGAFFDVLGAAPLAGRTFTADEVALGTEAVIVSERLHRRNPDVVRVGARLRIDGRPREIVGIMPASVAFPARNTDVWMPIEFDPRDPNYNANFASLIGRLPDDSSAEILAARLFPAARERARAGEDPDAIAADATVRPLQEEMVSDVRPALRVLLTAVLVVLVIGCLNIANVLLADGTARVQEFSVRTALGAGRARLVRQLLAEALTLAAIGGALGIASGTWLTGTLRAVLPADTPRLEEIAVDARVLAFSLALTIGTAILFGLFPAVYAAARPPAAALRGADRGGAGGLGGERRTRRVRAALVASEIALAVVLVTSAVLVARSYRAIAQVDPGFRTRDVTAVPLSLPPAAFEGEDRVRVGLERIERELAAVPGVASVGAIQLLPLTPDNWNPDVAVDGHAPLPPQIATVNWRAVTPRYFETLGVPVVRGRALSPEDRAHTQPVAVINRRFAEVIFGREDPIGQRIRTGFEPAGTWVTVVGIVGDVRQHTLAQAPQPEMYRPIAQHPVPTLVWMVHTTGGAPLPLPAIRAAVRRIHPDIVFGEVRPLDALLAESGAVQRAAAALLLCVAAGALTIALVGMFSLTAYEAAQRRGEIGVRLALGATPSAVRRAMLVRATRLALIGVVAGIALALVTTRALGTLLVGVAPHEPVTYAAVAIGMAVAAVAFSYIPARRASAMQPLDVLRLQ